MYPCRASWDPVHRDLTSLNPAPIIELPRTSIGIREDTWLPTVQHHLGFRNVLGQVTFTVRQKQGTWFGKMATFIILGHY